MENTVKTVMDQVLHEKFGMRLGWVKSSDIPQGATRVYTGSYLEAVSKPGLAPEAKLAKLAVKQEGTYLAVCTARSWEFTDHGMGIREYFEIYRA